jgi:uncharacterized membrane protein
MNDWNSSRDTQDTHHIRPQDNMRVNNPFEANDWNIKKLLIAVFATELVLWLLIVLDSLGFEIPIVRQFFGVLNLLFLPGVLLLRIIRLHKLGSVETLLYSVGLSLFFSMVVGLLLNAAGAMNLMSRPLSFLPLLISTSASVLALSVLAYIRDKNFDDPVSVHLEGRLLQWTLILSFFPLASVFSAYLMNNYGSNTLSLILYIGICVTILYIAFSTTFPKELYPLAIFAIALALLFSTSLISSYIWGWDIQTEYYDAALVVHNGVWDWASPTHYNGMLSVVMIAPMISILGKIDLDFVFKVVYSLLFALMPVGLYAAFKRLTTEKIAFLSAFFIVGGLTFFLVLPQLARQEIAELFLALILLLLVGNEIRGVVKTSLLLVFSFSLIVSHYALSVIFMGVFLATVVGLNLIYFRKTRGARNKASKSGRWKRLEDTDPSNRNQSETLSFAFACLFIITAFVWYSYVSGGTVFATVLAQQQYFFESFTRDLGVSGSMGLSIATETIPTPLHQAATWVRFLFEFFIVTGFIITLSKLGRLKRNDTYLCIGLASLTLLIASAVLPNVGGFLNIARYYQIATLTLAPFCIVGGIFLADAAQKYLLTSRKPSFTFSIRLVAVLLVISFLFDSCTLYQVIEHDSQNIALSTTVDAPVFSTQEVAGANWWYAMRVNSSFIYGDALSHLLLMRMDSSPPLFKSTAIYLVQTLKKDVAPGPNYDVSASGQKAYVFFGTKNIKENGFAMPGVYGNYDYVNQSGVFSGRSEVYDSGGAQIYFG